MNEQLLIVHGPTTPDDLDARRRMADAALVILDRGNGTGRVVKDRYAQPRELTIEIMGGGAQPERDRPTEVLAANIASEVRRIRLRRAGLQAEGDGMRFEQMQESERQPFLDVAEAVYALGLA